MHGLFGIEDAGVAVLVTAAPLGNAVKHFGSGIELVATVARPWMRRSNHGLATVATLMARFLPAENASQRSPLG